MSKLNSRCKDVGSRSRGVVLVDAQRHSHLDKSIVLCEIISHDSKNGICHLEVPK